MSDILRFVANCPKCQYDLSGLAIESAQPVCPECGETIPDMQAHAGPSYRQRLLGFACPQLPALICLAWVSVDALLDEGGGNWNTMGVLVFVYPLLALIGLIVGGILYRDRFDNRHLSTLGVLVPAIILHVGLVYSALSFLPIRGC